MVRITTTAIVFSINNVSWWGFVVRVQEKSRNFAANFQICNFMIYFFRTPAQSVIATQVNHELSADETNELCWLYGEARPESENNLQGFFVGPRREMMTLRIYIIWQIWQSAAICMNKWQKLNRNS